MALSKFQIFKYVEPKWTKVLLFRRFLAQRVVKQDPEDVKNMPIFQYATETTKKTHRVYMWGNAMYGALGNPNYLRPKNHKSPLKTMHKPVRLSFGDLHYVTDVSCGYGFTVFVGSNKDTHYSLFGTGLNSDFQIGYHSVRKGNPLEILAQPVPILLPLFNTSTKAVHVSCGRAHTVVLTDKEGIFSLGNNAYGQCGVLHSPREISENNFRINKVEAFDDQIIKLICGQDHTMFLSASGRVYSCGWSADGQTGLGHYKNQITPAQVKGDIENEKIVQISCSADCILALSDKGDVFGWGNSEYGQFAPITDSQQLNIPRHLNFVNIGKVKQVASGGTMCGILTDDGYVYVWGYGILGQGPAVTHLSKPTLLPQPLFGYNQFSTDVTVEQLSCSLSHFAAVTNQGHLYMWGRNKSNCLGLGRTDDQYFPFKVCVPANVKKISCGVDHTAVICKSFA